MKIENIDKNFKAEKAHSDQDRTEYKIEKRNVQAKSSIIAV